MQGRRIVKLFGGVNTYVMGVICPYMISRANIKLVYDRIHYFGLCLIPKQKPKFVTTFGQYCNPNIQQTKMLVTCQRFGDLFLFGLIWQYSSDEKTYNKGSFKVIAIYLQQ